MPAPSDRLLYDAKTPDGAALPGGMGQRFDWTLLSRPSGAVAMGPFRRARCRQYCRGDPHHPAPLVDVSSGVESAPGVKDVDKIAAFCKAVS